MKEQIGEVRLHLLLSTQAHKSGKYPLYIRVQHRNRNQYFSAYSEMSPKEWERFEKCPEADHPATLQFKSFLEATSKLVRAGAFSLMALSQITGRGRKNTIQEMAENYAEEFRKKRKYNSASVYHNLAVSLDGFLKSPTPINRMTEERCREFLKWLSTDLKNGKTTISIKARSLTAILNQAVKLHMIESNPMDNIKKPTYQRRELAISHESLKKLLTADERTIGETNMKYLRFWQCVYYGNGINIKDLLLLRWSNLDRINNEIVFIRHKTEDSSGATVRVALIPELHAALSAISEPGGEYIIPVLNGIPHDSEQEFRTIRQTTKNINNHLKKICTILDIPEKVKTYTGRHCFATILQQQNVPIEFISKAMGHSSVRTTQNYLNGYTGEQRRKTATLLNKI